LVHSIFSYQNGHHTLFIKTNKLNWKESMWVIEVEVYPFTNDLLSRSCYHTGDHIFTCVMWYFSVCENTWFGINLDVHINGMYMRKNIYTYVGEKSSMRTIRKNRTFVPVTNVGRNKWLIFFRWQFIISQFSLTISAEVLIDELHVQWFC